MQILLLITISPHIIIFNLTVRHDGSDQSVVIVTYDYLCARIGIFCNWHFGSAFGIYVYDLE